MFGPDRLTPNEMAKVISAVLDRSMRFTQLTLDDVAQALSGRGVRRNESSVPRAGPQKCVAERCEVGIPHEGRAFWLLLIYQHAGRAFHQSQSF